VSEYTKTIIKREADRIRQEIAREGYITTLFGEPVDISNQDAVLVAAVYLEQQKGNLNRVRDFDLFKILAR
jgi:hypothetical protein